VTQNSKFISFPGEICLIRDDSDLLSVDFQAVKEFGFDTETKPAFKSTDNHKTALLQLATDSVAYLFRLHHITRFDTVRAVLENGKVLKVGAAITHDLKQLQRIFPFQPRGFVDIQKLAREQGRANLGLKGLTGEVLGAALTKGPKMTNWERRDLTEEQLRYAATDAWIGLELYRRMTAK